VCPEIHGGKRTTIGKLKLVRRVTKGPLVLFEVKY